MRSMRWMLTLACLLFSAAPTRADVTVLYAEPAPRAPLVAEVVPDVASERVAPEASTEPMRPEATEAVSEPAPPTPSPAAGTSPTAPSPTPAAAAIEPTTETSAEPATLPVAPGAPVRFVRVGDGSGDSITVMLLDEEGRPSPDALTALSVLARPNDADAPSEPALAAHAADLEWVAPELRRLHPGLMLRLAALSAEFTGHTIEIISGYRPDARDTSRHRIGSALDVRVVGVPVDDVDAFLRTLPETGVGLYPTSDFVHLDVRAESAHWTDVSGPGEPPRAAVAAPIGRRTERTAPAVVIDAEAMATDVGRALSDLRF